MREVLLSAPPCHRGGNRPREGKRLAPDHVGSKGQSWDANQGFRVGAHGYLAMRPLPTAGQVGSLAPSLPFYGVLGERPRFSKAPLTSEMETSSCPCRGDVLCAVFRDIRQTVWLPDLKPSSSYFFSQPQ